VNKTEALSLLEATLLEYRNRPYEALRAMIDETKTFDSTAPSGVAYQLEIQALWDNRRGGPIRVIGSIDDGGWRSYKPLTADFIMAPDGSFVDE
jgi:hypothetical protein